MFALVDCNNFYASCERVFRPDLRRRPVVVLSNNDGCVIARSAEAKAMGIPMGAPAFQHEKMFERNGVQVFSANFALYGDMSGRVMSILAGFASDMEIYSIDEAFLEFDDNFGFNYDKFGNEIERTVRRSTGIPISIGFAASKTLAKVANRIAKKFPERTGGVYVIDSEDKRDKALKWLPVEDVWGIGRRHTKRLNRMGITRAWDFVLLPDQWVRKNMTVVGLRMKRELLGEPMLAIDDDAAPKKNIATTRTFEANYSNIKDVRERVITFAATCAEKLRRQRSKCNALMVFVHTNPHRDDHIQYARNVVVRTPWPTNSSIELARVAEFGLERIFREGYYYKKAGVIVMDIVPDRPFQLGLFGNSNPRHEAAMRVMDAINEEIGYKELKLASQDRRTWKMRQERLSPRYTTKLNEIITIHAE
ncbi:MAG: Y-family DNA polymerase [Candidatus Kapaibacterium sp.]